MRWLRWAAPLLAVLAGLLLLVGYVAITDQAQRRASGCGGPAVVPAAQVPGQIPGAPGGSVAGYSGAQLVGAAQIMRAGADAGLGVQGQTIGVMTSMGESSLTAVDHGDKAGPDSLGWFQQRDPWGPREVRLDAYGSATMFFTGGRGGQPGLLDVQGWETLPPTIAAHRVQRNADPFHYAKYWTAATQVVAALGGGLAPAPGAGTVPCQDTPVLAGGPTAGGWIKPAVGTFTSGFGMRWGKPHNGIDLGAPCGTPVVAAAAGDVVLVVLNNGPPATGYGTLVVVDHGVDPGTGQRVLTRYAHAFPKDVLVRAGDHVNAGDQLTRIGTFGNSTGCHLHFEVLLGGSTTSGFTDPVPFLRARGVDLTGA